MRRHSILVVLAALMAAAGCTKKPDSEPGGKAAAPAPRQDMNILLVTIDTLRADYLSCYGRKTVQTPHIDALAARGVRFDRAIAHVPLTAPSHASILTGTLPTIHGIRDMGGFYLDDKVPTLASILSQAGFETAAFIGAAVLNRHYGMDRGFKTYDDRMRDESGQKKLPGVVAEVRGEVVAQRALDWMRGADSAKPFLLWVHFYDPHFPYDPPEPYRSRYQNDPYGGEVAYTDEQVGRLVAGLRERNLEARTLVVLMADHGESLGEHGEYTHGVFLYDSTVRVPMIIAGPGVPQNRVLRGQVRAIDVHPTISDFVGVSPGDRSQGMSLKDAILAGAEPPDTPCYLETLYPKTQMGWSELHGLRTNEWKLIVAPKEELYRLPEDVGEAKNSLAQYPAEADRLRKTLREAGGAAMSGRTLQPQPIDNQRRRELDALGYLGSGQRAITLDKSGADPKDRREVLGTLEKASEAMNRDRWKEAAPMLEKIVDADPSNPLIYKNLQMCYERLGQLGRLERACLRAIENKAESDDTYANLGEILIRKGDLAAAVKPMEKAARINPANLQNMDNLATAYLQLGRPEDAERALRAILSLDPRRAMAHNTLGLLEIQRQRVEEGRRHLEKAIEGNPGMAEPYMNLGLLAEQRGDTNTAIKYYRQFLKRADREKHREYIPKVREVLSQLGATP